MDRKMCCCLKDEVMKEYNVTPQCKIVKWASQCSSRICKFGKGRFFKCDYHAYWRVSEIRGSRCILDSKDTEGIAMLNQMRESMLVHGDGMHPRVQGALPLDISGWRAPDIAKHVRVFVVRHGYSIFNRLMEEKKGFTETWIDAKLTPRGQDEAVASQVFFQKQLQGVAAEQIQLAGSLLSRAYDTLVLATALVWSGRGEAGRKAFRMDQLPALMEFGGGPDVNRRSETDSDGTGLKPVSLADSSLGSGSALLPEGYEDFYEGGEEGAEPTWYTDKPYEVRAAYPRWANNGECTDTKNAFQISIVLHYLASQALSGKSHVVIGSHSKFLRCLFRNLKGKGVLDGLATLGDGSSAGTFNVAADKLPNGGVASFDLSVSTVDSRFPWPTPDWENSLGNFSVQNLAVWKPGSDFPVSGEISLTIVRGTGLLAADTNGLSDPFVIVESGGAFAAKTEVQKKTLNPQWHWRAPSPIAVTSPYQRLRFLVYDWDRITRNDKIGLGEVTLKQLLKAAEEAGDQQEFMMIVDLYLSVGTANSIAPGDRTGNLTVKFSYFPAQSR